MFGYICSPDLADDIREVLRDEQVIFSQVGTFDPEMFIQLCTQAANVSIDILIVDMTCCTDEGIIRGIRKYRVTRSSRVILIAPGREPGDKAISAMVADGVYDIVAPPLPNPDDEDAESLVRPYLERQLSMSYHMGNAARWRSIDEEYTAPQPKPAKERTPVTKRQRNHPDIDPLEIEELLGPVVSRPKETVIFREKIIGTTTIAMAGTGRRTGNTVASIRLACALANKGFSVACCERVVMSPPVFYCLESDGDSSRVDGGIRRNGVDFFKSADDDLMLKIFSAGYQYVVLDLGVLNDQSTAEFVKADVPIITTGSADWDFRDLLSLLDHFHKHNWKRSWSVLVNLATKRVFQEFDQALSGRDKELLKVKFFHNLNDPDPFNVDDEFIRLAEQLLSDVLPRENKKKRFFLSF